MTKQTKERTKTVKIQFTVTHLSEPEHQVGSFSFTLLKQAQLRDKWNCSSRMKFPQAFRSLVNSSTKHPLMTRKSVMGGQAGLLPFLLSPGCSAVPKQIKTSVDKAYILHLHPQLFSCGSFLQRGLPFRDRHWKGNEQGVFLSLWNVTVLRSQASPIANERSKVEIHQRSTTFLFLSSWFHHTIDSF